MTMNVQGIPWWHVPAWRFHFHWHSRPLLHSNQRTWLPSVLACRCGHRKRFA